MVNINTVWTESKEFLALETLAGGTGKKVDISDLDTQDIVGLFIIFNEHDSATAGLRIKIMARNPLTGVGTDGIAYGDTGITFDMDELGTRLQTTVDADSSGVTVNLTATTNASFGSHILIDPGNANGEEELAVIVAVSAGVSVTVGDTLANDPTAANGSAVDEVVTRYVPLYGMSDASVLLTNLDGTNTCEIAIFGITRDWVSV